MCFRNANGINVLWRMESFKDEWNWRNHSVDINWPSSEIVFNFSLICADIFIGIIDVDDSDDDVCCFQLIKVRRIDNSEESIALYVKASVVSPEDLIPHIDVDSKIHLVNFENNTSESFPLPHSKKYILSNGTLTVLIQLWNSPEKNINVNYFAYSNLARQEYKFEWILDTQSEKTGISKNGRSCHQFHKIVPRKLTSVTSKKKNELLGLLLAFKSFSREIKWYIFKPNPECDFNGTSDYSGKINIDAISENGNIYNLIDEYILCNIFYAERYNLTKFHTVFANKHLFFPHRNLTLNVFIENIFYLNEVIEVDYLSDTQNIEALVERSNKLRKYVNEKSSSTETLNASIYSLYKGAQFCDVTICVGKRKFLCHKSVLCARSPVFRNLFENDVQESKSNVLQIQDMNGLIFEIFLCILYTDSLPDVEWNDVFEVYKAANKYDVPEARMICSNFLLSKISMTNLCQILEFCLAYQNEVILRVIKQFIALFAKEVIKLPEWNCFVSKNPLFAAKIIPETLST